MAAIQTSFNLNESIQARSEHKTKWEAEIKAEFEQSKQVLVDKIYEKVINEFQSRVRDPFLKMPNRDCPVFKYFKIDIRKPFNPLMQEVFTGEKFKNLMDINRILSKKMDRLSEDSQTTNETFPDYDYINSKLSELAERLIDDLGLKFAILKRQPGNASFYFKVEMCIEEPSSSSTTSKMAPTLFPGVQIALWIQQEAIRGKR